MAELEYTEKFVAVTQPTVDSVNAGPYLDEMNARGAGEFNR